LVAEKLFKQAIDLNPVFADAYESLGVMLGRMERFSEAIEVMDQLSKVDPSSVLAHTNKSLFLMKLGKIPEAENEKSLATIKSFQKFGDEAKIKEKIDEEKKHLELEWAKRENMYQQVIEIDADDTLANYGLGSIAVERKNWASAVSYLERVVKVDPQYSVAYLSLGKAYKGCGLIELAASTWKEGISIAAKKGDLMPANQMQSELQQL
jgi:tetratricopeptide (TPR) repeat protein